MKTDINDSHVHISHDSLVFFSYTHSFSFLIHIVLDDNEHVSILNKEIESLKRQVELPFAEASVLSLCVSQIRFARETMWRH